MPPRPDEDEDIPGAARALWRALALAYQAEPKLLIVSFALITSAMIPEALNALWLKLLGDGVDQGRSSLIVTASIGFAASGSAGWLLRIVGDRVHFLFRERATIAIESHIVGLQAGVATIEHHERPEYLDRLQILKDHAFLLNHLYHSAMSTLGSLIRLGITVVLLVSVHPALLGLFLFAVPTLIVSSRRASRERVVEESVASQRRAARHFYDLGTQAGPAKEIRVGRAETWLVGKRRAALENWFRAVNRIRWRSAGWHAFAWALFGAGYAAAIVFVALVIDRSAGDVLLVLAAGANLSQYMGMTAGQAQFLRWTLDAAARLAWLEDYAKARTSGEAPAPKRLERGIRVDDVSFSYPGTDRLVLQNVDLDLPAGKVVAIVGENGAGKTTLVKLLCRFYEPTSGRILVDGKELSSMAADEWRSRLAGAFQDFFRYELFARETVGLGDLVRMDEVPALRTAIERGGADDVIERLPKGLDTQLGPAWEEGVELSFGQWQKLALARGFMRDHPLLLVLDEPTAALDAETEHALFERFADSSRDAAGDGRVTILVSHRFSTVRMADLIVVLDGAHVVETGSHDELMARNGLYAELYGIQARAYRS
ncbi:MAG: ABC transporter ATP-binding protein [Actinomycetota bacterium]